MRRCSVRTTGRDLHDVVGQSFHDAVGVLVEWNARYGAVRLAMHSGANIQGRSFSALRVRPTAAWRSASSDTVRDGSRGGRWAGCAPSPPAAARCGSRVLVHRRGPRSIRRPRRDLHVAERASARHDRVDGAPAVPWRRSRDHAEHVDAREAPRAQERDADVLLRTVAIQDAPRSMASTARRRANSRGSPEIGKG